MGARRVGDEAQHRRLPLKQRLVDSLQGRVELGQVDMLRNVGSVWLPGATPMTNELASTDARGRFVAPWLSCQTGAVYWQRTARGLLAYSSGGRRT